MAVRPFVINVPEERLRWIRHRLEEARWPNVAEGTPWAYGAESSALRGLVGYWLGHYDWRAREEAINRWPQVMVDTEVDGVPYAIHALHVPAKGAPGVTAPVVLMTHGWPGSFVEFLDCIERLTDPAATGGDARDAVTLVLPSLIGFGFSAKPPKPIGSRTVARAFAQMMEALGYPSYVAQGGDWGASVAGWLGYEAPGCRALHLNFTYGWTNPEAKPETPEEKAAFARMADIWRTEGGYMAIQSTKPMTLSFAMADSPLGVAAWILEKFHGWSDLAEGGLWETYSRERVLDNIMVYLVSASVGTASWIYRGVLDEPVPAGARVEKPVAVASFPGERLHFPRSFVEKSYSVVRWSELPKGGHFAAMEQPALFARDLQDALRSLP